MALRIGTPTAELRWDGVTHLRFEASDGSRGVLPGHERAQATLRAGVIEFVRGRGDSSEALFVAAEPGIARITPGEVVVLTTWAVADRDPGGLLDALQRRAQERSEAERDARALATQHDVSVRNALAKLRREPAA